MEANREVKGRNFLFTTKADFGVKFYSENIGTRFSLRTRSRWFRYKVKIRAGTGLGPSPRARAQCPGLEFSKACYKARLGSTRVALHWAWVSSGLKGPDDETSLHSWSLSPRKNTQYSPKPENSWPVPALKEIIIFWGEKRSTRSFVLSSFKSKLLRFFFARPWRSEADRRWSSGISPTP